MQAQVQMANSFQQQEMQFQQMQAQNALSQQRQNQQLMLQQQQNLANISAQRTNALSPLLGPAVNNPLSANNSNAGIIATSALGDTAQPQTARQMLLGN